MFANRDSERWDRRYSDITTWLQCAFITWQIPGDRTGFGFSGKTQHEKGKTGESGRLQRSYTRGTRAMRRVTVTHSFPHPLSHTHWNLSWKKNSIPLGLRRCQKTSEWLYACGVSLLWAEITDLPLFCWLEDRKHKYRLNIYLLPYATLIWENKIPTSPFQAACSQKLLCQKKYKYLAHDVKRIGSRVIIVSVIKEFWWGLLPTWVFSLSGQWWAQLRGSVCEFV